MAASHLQEESDDVLVVLVLHVLPFHTVLFTRAPLVHEDVLHEELLQLLVGHVDAQLLEAVDAHVLEARHVQHADSGAATITANNRRGWQRVMHVRTHTHTHTHVCLHTGRT